MSHTDTFTRTTSYGLGTDGTWTYDFNSRNTAYANDFDSLFLVDGTKLVLPVNDYDSYTITGAAPGAVGSAQFDYYIPSISSSAHYRGSVILRLNPTGCAQPITLSVTDSASWWGTPDPIAAPTMLVGPAWGDDNDPDRPGGGEVLTLPFEPDNWYTAKVGWRADGKAGYKFWKRSDPEPGVWFVITSGETSSFSDNWIDFYYDSDESVAYLDNLVLDDTDPGIPDGGFTADAIIVKEVFCDDFQRTTAYGIGGDYRFIPAGSGNLGFDSNFSTESSSNSSVDNSIVSNALTIRASQTSAYYLPIKAAPAGFVKWDFLAITNQFQIRTVFEDGRNDYPVFVQAQYIPGPNIFIVNTGSGSSVSLTNNTWYTVLVAYSETTVELWVYAQGDTPDNAIYHQGPSAISQTSYAAGDRIAWSGGGADTAFDNFCYTVQPHGFTADAFIFAPTTSFTAKAVIKRNQTGSFTADALIAVRHTGSFTANAVIPPYFKANAYITDLNLQRHYRERDHTGTILDTSVTLDQAVGPWPAGTNLHDLLRDLWDWATRVG